MAKDIQDVDFRINAFDGASAAFRQVGGAIGQVEKQWSSMTSVMAGTALGAAVGGAIGTVFSQMVAEIRQAEQLGQRFNAVLRATGNTAGFTRGQLNDMADSVSSNTLFDDDAIRGAMTNLIKFQNIQGAVFREAIQLSADYAAMTGGDVAGAAQTVGKALQSPTLGFEALKEDLGRLSLEQERSIKAFMEQGRVAQAQGVVLDFLRGKLKGTAEEMNSGLNGALVTVGKNWADVLKAMGRSDATSPATGFVRQLADELKIIQRIFEAKDWTERARLFFAGFTVFGDKSALGMGLITSPDASGRTAVGKIGGLPQAPIPKTQEQLEAEKRMAESSKKIAEDFEEHQRQQRRQRNEEIAKEAERGMQLAGVEYQERKKLLDEDQQRRWQYMAENFNRVEADAVAQGQVVLREYHATLEAQKNANAAMRDWNLKAEQKAQEEGLEFTRQAARNVQTTVSDMLYNYFDNRTESMGQRFGSMLKRMAAELAASNINRLLLGDYGRSGDVGGLLGNVISGIGGSLFGGGGSTFGQAEGFATGGSFVVGGAGGTDSKMVKFRATPGERVTIETPDQQRRSGGITVINNNNFSLGVQNTVRAEVASMMPQITMATTAAVAEAQGRGKI